MNFFDNVNDFSGKAIIINKIHEESNEHALGDCAASPPAEHSKDAEDTNQIAAPTRKQSQGQDRPRLDKCQSTPAYAYETIDGDRLDTLEDKLKEIKEIRIRKQSQGGHSPDQSPQHQSPQHQSPDAHDVESGVVHVEGSVLSNPNAPPRMSSLLKSSIYSTLAKFMKKLLLPTDLLVKTENSKAFIYLRVRAIIFLRNELCTEMNQACEYNFFVFFK